MDVIKKNLLTYLPTDVKSILSNRIAMAIINRISFREPLKRERHSQQLDSSGCSVSGIIQVQFPGMGTRMKN